MSGEPRCSTAYSTLRSASACHVAGDADHEDLAEPFVEDDLGGTRESEQDRTMAKGSGLWRAPAVRPVALFLKGETPVRKASFPAISLWRPVRP